MLARAQPVRSAFLSAFFALVGCHGLHVTAGLRLHLVESGASICNRNRIMTGVRFLSRVTLRRHDLAAEVWHIKEPQKLPPVLSPEEVRRVLAMATSLKARAMLTLSYGCGLRAGEVVRLRAGDIDSEQMIIRIVQSKGRKDRHVMLPAEILDLLRQWWKACDASRPLAQPAEKPASMAPATAAATRSAAAAPATRSAAARSAAARSAAPSAAA